VVAHSRSHSIDLSVAGRRAGWTPGAAPCAASSLAEPLFVGLDVSKSWVDSADSAGRKQRVSNDAAALTAPLEGYRGVCANMVCEATGGCERALLQVAAERAPPGTVRNLVCGAIVTPMEGVYGNQERHPGRFAGGA
jgi:hypothetical protein